MENYNFEKVTVLITGGAGFIGSNLCDFFIQKNCKKVICLDNFSTGKKKNINHLINKNNFTLIKGDIRDLDTCQKACQNVDFVLHQAALGSVPRSIKDPITTNDVNISGFLNMLIASRDQNVNRFIFAASSSTYGDSSSLPKVEEVIGKPLSPYAITKYVNELYASIFKFSYDLDYVGLRYFNVFGRRQDSESVYAAVIPNFVKKLINHESPVINGDGLYSRDFTFIQNIVQMNVLAMTTKNEKAINTIYNAAGGQRTNLLELIILIKSSLSKFDNQIKNIKTIHGPIRDGDIPHSLASIEKAKTLLGYKPLYNVELGIKESIEWYCKNLV
jgi:UDP-N-acetylglucosamine/UDP-N-acetylgalactosamine 4-epimerase